MPLCVVRRVETADRVVLVSEGVMYLNIINARNFATIDYNYMSAVLTLGNYMLVWSNEFGSKERI
jgi:hypothetical protein